MKVTQTLIILFSFLSLSLQANRVYVDQNAGGANNGSSWEDAYTSLQTAIEAAVAGDEIWIAAGIYKPSKDETGNPNPSDARYKVFYINKDIKLYGGFNGTESSLEERDWEANLTVLSGDIDNNDLNGDGNFIAESYTHIVGTNTYRVMWLSDVGTDCLVDGFVLTAGRLTGGGHYAGMMIRARFKDCTPVVRNCRFHGHQAYRGAALSIIGRNPYKADPTIEYCLFSGNRGVNRASCIYSNAWTNGSGPTFMTVRNCVFENNDGNLGTAVFNHGGYAHGSVMVNCVFRNNTSVRGGAIFNYYPGNHQFINCTFVNNHASVGGGAIRMESAGLTSVKNSIFWANTSSSGKNLSGAVWSVTLSHCLMSDAGCPGANCGAGMIYNQNPLFMSMPADLRLLAGSPAIDAGTADGAPSDDLNGYARPFPCSAEDIGAYEYQGSPALITCYRDSDNDTYGDPGALEDFCDACGEGYVTDNTDCSDGDPLIHPDQLDLCDNIDNDCDGAIDEDAAADPDPATSLENYISLIESLVQSGVLADNKANSLINQLEQVIKKLTNGQTNAAENQMNAFNQHLEGWVANGTIDESTGEVLQSLGECLSGSIGGGLRLGNPGGIIGAPNITAINGSLSSFHLFPNPSRGQITLNLSNYLEQRVSITIFHALGQEVYRLPAQILNNPVLNIALDRQQLPEGVYYLSVLTEQGRAVKQFVLAH